MTQVTWILDDSRLLERLSTYGPGMVATLGDLGIPYHLCERFENGTFSNVEVAPESAVVVYGSHEFIRAINPKGQFQPGALGLNEKTRASAYMSNLPLEWFLNRDGIFMTWAMFKRRAKELFYIYDCDTLFIRPDSGFKVFAGQTVKFGTLTDDLNSLDQLSGVMDETMILVNTTQNLLGEFRFVIADRKVVTGSEYRWDNKLDIRRDWPAECEALARKVAEHEWQVDIAYTCDVALLEDGPKLVELNSFSCAGLYACDLSKVVQSVSQAAIREFLGDDVDLSEDR